LIKRFHKLFLVTPPVIT